MIDISSILGVNLRKYGKAHNRLIFFTKKTNNLSKYILIVLSLVNNKCNILIAIRTAIPKPTTLSAIKTAVRQKLFNTIVMYLGNTFTKTFHLRYFVCNIFL